MNVRPLVSSFFGEKNCCALSNSFTFTDQGPRFCFHQRATSKRLQTGPPPGRHQRRVPGRCAHLQQRGCYPKGKRGSSPIVMQI